MTRARYPSSQYPPCRRHSVAMSRSSYRSGDEEHVAVHDRGTPLSIHVTESIEHPNVDQRYSLSTPVYDGFLTFQNDSTYNSDGYEGMDTYPGTTGNKEEMDINSDLNSNSPLPDQHSYYSPTEVNSAQPTSRTPSSPQSFFRTGHPLATSLSRLRIVPDPSPQGFGSLHTSPSSAYPLFTVSSTGTLDRTSVSPDTPAAGTLSPLNSQALPFPLSPSHNLRGYEKGLSEYGYEQTQDASSVHDDFFDQEPNDHIYQQTPSDGGFRLNTNGLDEFFYPQIQGAGADLPQAGDVDYVHQLSQVPPLPDASSDTSVLNGPVYRKEQMMPISSEHLVRVLNHQQPSLLLPLTTTGDSSQNQRLDDNPPAQGQVIHKTIGTERVVAHTRSKRKDGPQSVGLHLCDICGQDFTAAHNLKHHRNSHLGIKPYSCDHCPYSATTSHTLKRHASTKHAVQSPN